MNNQLWEIKKEKLNKTNLFLYSNFIKKKFKINMGNDFNKIWKWSVDNPKNFWQMPQGGVDGNEDFYSAALRELKEETSIVSVKLIKEIEDKLTYILPDHLIGIIWKGKFKGQKQKWFIMKFVGKENEINVKTKNPEFLDWKWIEVSKLPSIAVSFKVNLYKKLKKELNFLNPN